MARASDLPFLLHPTPALLERHLRHQSAHATPAPDIQAALTGSSVPAHADSPSEIEEELSASELRVLRYLPSGLSASEIGEELYLSLNTVKTHLRHIYDKLGVHRRIEAVERARERELLGSASQRR